MKREFYERILLCTTFIPPVIMLFVACVCCNKKRKTRFVIAAMSGIIDEKTVNNERVLIFGGRRLPDLEYKTTLWTPRTRKEGLSERLYEYCANFFLVLERPCCCCIRKPYFSLGNALLVFSIMLRSVLLQIFVVLATLEVTYKCRYDLYLDCFDTFKYDHDAYPINCTLADPLKKTKNSVQMYYTCYRLVFFYPNYWLQACVYTFLFTKLLHLLFRILARFMVNVTNCSVCSRNNGAGQRNDNSNSGWTCGLCLSACCVRFISCTLSFMAYGYTFISIFWIAARGKYRVQYITLWRVVAAAILTTIFLWLIPWREIGDNQIEMVNEVSTETRNTPDQEPPHSPPSATMTRV